MIFFNAKKEKMKNEWKSAQETLQIDRQFGQGTSACFSIFPILTSQL